MSAEFLRIQDFSDQTKEKYLDEAEEKALALEAQKASEKETAKREATKREASRKDKVEIEEFSNRSSRLFPKLLKSMDVIQKEQEPVKELLEKQMDFNNMMKGFISKFEQNNQDNLLT